MSFSGNRRFSQIFYEKPGGTGQYGLLSDITPIPRKPVGSGPNPDEWVHPDAAPFKSPVPNRKPVGGDRTKPTASTTKPKPQSSSRANRSGGPDLNKALPRIPNNATVPFIACDSQGKFDQRHKTPEGRAPQAPIGSTQRAELPPLAKAQLASLPKPASRPTTARLDSNGIPPLKRTGSGLSDFFKSSSRPGSRRGSLQDAARNLGKWAKTKTEILTMNQAQRDSYVKGATRAHQVEAARQADPSTRPQDQKRLIIEKQKAKHPDQSWGLGPVDTAFAAQMEERAFRKRMADGYEQIHEEKCAAARLEGKPRPVTPDCAKYSPPTRSLTSEERSYGLECDPESDKSMLTMTEKLALGVSRKLDAFKSSRKDSDCSDMDFGMTDSAPAGAIEFCGQIPATLYYKQGCNMPSRTHLKQGLCEDCYQYRKGGDSRDSSATRRRKGHNPISPEDDAKGGDLYIRLPAKKRLREVRNTVYEDPGNPFNLGAINPPSSPPASQETLTNEHINDDDQWDSWDEDDPSSSSGTDSKRHSTISNPFDHVKINPFDPAEEANRTYSRRETLKPSRPNRRSMSVDIGFLPARHSLKRNDLTNADQNWPGDVPLLYTKHPSGTIFTTESKRDTKFYNFYDDILAEYGVERSTGYGSIDYQLMSVTY